MIDLALLQAIEWNGRDGSCPCCEHGPGVHMRNCWLRRTIDRLGALVDVPVVPVEKLMVYREMDYSPGNGPIEPIVMVERGWWSDP